MLYNAPVIYAPFTTKSVSGINAMKQEYPLWFFDGSATVRDGMYDIL